jgi:signal transduction histidine kinase
MSVIDLRPVQLPKKGLFSRELQRLVTTVNDLFSRTTRIRQAEFEAVARSRDMILSAGAKGKITYVNEAGIGLLGDVKDRDLGDVIGLGPAAEILMPQDFKEWKGNVSLKRLDGTDFEGFLSSIPIAADGTLTSVVIVIADITRDRAAREAVVQSEESITLRELVAGTSHELNNPLAIVTGYSDLLLEDPTLDVEQRMKIESIRKNAMRAAGVVHGLLAFARKRQPQRVPGDITLMVESACRLKEYDLRTSGITFDKNLGAGLPAVLADPYQIQQVLLNLINNAQDAVANSKAPWIRIATESSPAGVVVRVEDSGIGTPSPNLNEVSEPSIQMQAGGKGNGLGLSVAYGIISEHGGDITIVSRPDGGNAISIVLPASPSGIRDCS